MSNILPPPKAVPRTVITLSSGLVSRLMMRQSANTRMARSTCGSDSNSCGRNTRSSPTAPIIVRSAPGDMCSRKPLLRINSTTAATDEAAACFCMIIIICRFLLSAVSKGKCGRW